MNSMEKLHYACAEFMYRVVLGSRNFQRFLEHRRKSEGSTQQHVNEGYKPSTTN